MECKTKREKKKDAQLFFGQFRVQFVKNKNTDHSTAFFCKAVCVCINRQSVSLGRLCLDHQAVCVCIIRQSVCIISYCVCIIRQSVCIISYCVCIIRQSVSVSSGSLCVLSAIVSVSSGSLCVLSAIVSVSSGSLGVSSAIYLNLFDFWLIKLEVSSWVLTSHQVWRVTSGWSLSWNPAWPVL